MYKYINELNNDVEFSGSISEENIIKYENKLDIKFGIEYKEFLKEFGCLSVDYLEFYGICGNNNSIPSSIFATIKLREHNKNLPSNNIIFYEDGNGIFYSVDENDKVYKVDFDTISNINIKFKDFVQQKIKQLG